jgi:hypothetical protein
MRHKPKSIAALQLALGGLSNQMRVEVDSDIEISATTVGKLRKVTVWPENLAIPTTQDRYPENAVRVSRVSVATRTSPKRSAMVTRAIGIVATGAGGSEPLGSWRSAASLSAENFRC